MKSDLLSVNKAFSKQSAHFDEDDLRNPILQWMRSRVRNHVLKYLNTSSEILELNAGTGLDALYFIQQGCSVVATDISDGMIAQLHKKVADYNLEEKLYVKQLSYTNLESLYGRQFDHIFSNFGGLNCTEDLKVVTNQFKHLLKPGGHVTLVIMQPVCPWEIAMALKGKIKYAFRRLRSKHTIAHLEGEYFDTWYFAPRNVITAFGKDYKKIRLEGLATFVPPPEFIRFPKRFPRMFRTLKTLDEQLCTYFPFNKWGDHFIITLQYQPRS